MCHTLPPSFFHLAFHVTDLDVARDFYVQVLGCTPGRRSDTWVDVSLFGHQLSMHLGPPFTTTDTGQVGDHRVPMPHFGLVLRMPDWQAMRARLEAHDVTMVIAPHLRFEGLAGEQATMFFRDPFGNPIEIKGFANWDDVFAE